MTGKSFPRPELVDHTLDFGDRGTGCFSSKEFKRVQVFGFLRLLSRLDDHSALYPHFNPVGDGQVGALRDKDRGELCVSGAEDLVIERLTPYVSVRSGSHN